MEFLLFSGTFIGELVLNASTRQLMIIVASAKGSQI